MLNKKEFVITILIWDFIIIFIIIWYISSFGIFYLKDYISIKMNRYGITTNMTLEDACFAGLDGIDRRGKQHSLNRYSTVEDLLARVLR